MIAEHGPPFFQRGVLHVFFPRCIPARTNTHLMRAAVTLLTPLPPLPRSYSLLVHLFVVHLHAHDARARGSETEHIVRLLKTLLDKDADARIVVMGDMNTLSRWDAE